jgi:alpha-tubulin suppressor-like RCC1 family protein
MDKKSSTWFTGALVLSTALSLGACFGGGGDGANAGSGAGAGAGSAGTGSAGTGSAGTGSAGTGSAGTSSDQDAGPASGSFRLVDDGLKCLNATEPSSTTIRVGGDCFVGISATYDEEFSEPIVLSAADLPPGVTVEITNIEPEGLLPNTRSNVYIHVRGVAAAGPLEIKLEGTTASHGSDTLTFPLTITSQPGFALAHVSVGYDVACGVDESGQGYCWGDNSSGQLGIGTSGEIDDDYRRSKPTAVDSPIAFSKIVAGADTTCGLDTDGRAYCWGDGWLGDGPPPLDPRPTPAPVAGDLSFVDIAPPGLATCGLTTDGALYCWAGSNGYLGDGTWDSSEVPTDVSAGRSYEAIANGGNSACALATGGAVYCWGDNTWGQLGDGTTEHRFTPTPVNTSLTFRSIAMGFASTCGLTDEGTAYCWGRNDAGELGLGDFDTDDHFSPVPVSGGLTFTSLVGASEGFCGLDEAGRAYCWGFAGTEDHMAVAAPTLITGELTFSQIAVGKDMSCGIATNGLEATYCWAHGSGNYDGYLGTGDNEDYTGPVPIASP